jgi:hypothetical protein
MGFLMPKWCDTLWNRTITSFCAAIGTQNYNITLPKNQIMCLDFMRVSFFARGQLFISASRFCASERVECFSL